MKVRITLILGFGTLLLLALLAYGWFDSKAYYPALPYEGGSKKEAAEQLERSNRSLVTLAETEDYVWLGIRGNQLEGREKLIGEMESRGFTYDTYDGSGIFFYAEDQQRMIITAEMWTAQYVLYKVPVESYKRPTRQ